MVSQNRKAHLKIRGQFNLMKVETIMTFTIYIRTQFNPQKFRKTLPQAMKPSLSLHYSQEFLVTQEIDHLVLHLSGRHSVMQITTIKAVQMTLELTDMVYSHPSISSSEDILSTQTILQAR
jgi:hypothetical protein